MLGSRVRVKTWSWFADDKQEIGQVGLRLDVNGTAVGYCTVAPAKRY